MRFLNGVMMVAYVASIILAGVGAYAQLSPYVWVGLAVATVPASLVPKYLPTFVELLHWSNAHRLSAYAYLALAGQWIAGAILGAAVMAAGSHFGRHLDEGFECGVLVASFLGAVSAFPAVLDLYRKLAIAESARRITSIVAVAGDYSNRRDERRRALVEWSEKILRLPSTRYLRYVSDDKYFLRKNVTTGKLSSSDCGHLIGNFAGFLYPEWQAWQAVFNWHKMEKMIK